MILLDTHIWVRWQNAPETLPPNILDWLAESDGLAVSAISCWEVAMLARKQRIKLNMSIDEWIDEALAFTGQCLPIDRHILLLAASLPEHHRDPADRIIIATAIVHQARLISMDSQFPMYAELKDLLIPNNV
ncbi:MAG: type II toxin-antitoxin system VapC family toxin [Gallionella sp.]|nr:type II toxin-antitoxin system VapC family toxin [Gallionella sp.]